METIASTGIRLFCYADSKTCQGIFHQSGDTEEEYQWWVELVNRRAGAGAGQGEGGVQHVTTENE